MAAPRTPNFPVPCLSFLAPVCGWGVIITAIIARVPNPYLTRYGACSSVAHDQNIVGTYLKPNGASDNSDNSLAHARQVH